MKRNDILWKAALEDLFDDFLRFFYPNAESLFDLQKGFEYLDKELDQLFPPEFDNYAPRYVDKLVKVFTHTGKEEWILVHVEVQGYADPDFAARMFQYYYRILDKYAKPITAFAIFTDSNKSFSPSFFEYEFLGTKVYYGYNTCKIIDQDEAKLISSNNPFAMAVLSAKIAINSKRDQQLFDLSADMVRQLLKMQMPKEKIRKVMNFLRYYIRFENSDIFNKFERELETLTEKSNTMGIEEFLLDSAEKKGIEKGREEGREMTIRETALKMKKSGLDIALIANITGLSAEEIEKLK